jgi:hypothetical protein
MRLHHLQGVLTLYLARATTFLKFQLHKISRLWCSRDRRWIIKYDVQSVSNYNKYKLFAWWLHQRKDYTYKTIQIVNAATTRTSTCYDY